METQPSISQLATINANVFWHFQKLETLPNILVYSLPCTLFSISTLIVPLPYSLVQSRRDRLRKYLRKSANFRPGGMAVLSWVSCHWSRGVSLSRISLNIWGDTLVKFLNLALSLVLSSSIRAS